MAGFKACNMFATYARTAEEAWWNWTKLVNTAVFWLMTPQEEEEEQQEEEQQSKR
jgi:hypothetical protein